MQTINERSAELRDQASVELRALAERDGPFEIVVSDPPWRFKSNSVHKPGRNAIRHYDCMTIEDISALPVRDIVAKDALLLLWATAPMLPEQLRVVQAWGFTYRTQLVWAKDRTGTGFWARNQHEVVLICRKGAFPCKQPGEDAPLGASVIDAPLLDAAVREHSRKPDQFYDRVDAVERWAGMRRLDMFTRQTRPGWTPFGDEATKFDRAPDFDDMLS